VRQERVPVALAALSQACGTIGPDGPSRSSAQFVGRERRKARAHKESVVEVPNGIACACECSGQRTRTRSRPEEQVHDHGAQHWARKRSKASRRAFCTRQRQLRRDAASARMLQVGSQGMRAREHIREYLNTIRLTATRRAPVLNSRKRRKRQAIRKSQPPPAHRIRRQLPEPVKLRPQRRD
jgi:hypothetical protein